jgi:hypothetical protein
MNNNNQKKNTGLIILGCFLAYIILFKSIFFFGLFFDIIFAGLLAYLTYTFYKVYKNRKDRYK